MRRILSVIGLVSGFALAAQRPKIVLIVTSTVCSLSRYSFLTGRFAGRCEGEKFLEEHPPGDQTQVENIGELEPERWNLPKVLRKNGYRKGVVGKSHMVRVAFTAGNFLLAGGLWTR